ncbi:uncharacterized protein RHIMIDRAFT_247297 [Rhizopus microsporus ATCC 52813]|uniref:Uncharacterized protein n=1 Tax=Rhizopus microsporus ATCC 52813 TaxID=1340429 RepID=A0A2G4T734_RHIZD|nr:uncharacterized protein RHIMIDRAFT_247297 [Rhizopus microsporus ATCC 52813]PHZ16835.1 hypothetical protein RHIMIDRAFT_247297 [Rhizopus microsporus ATCC 52813]
MPLKRLAPSSSAPKSKKQKIQTESSLEGISLQPDKSYFTRKCKISSFLNQGYKEYRQILRVLAEEFLLLRAYAMNLRLLIISNWIEKGCKKDQFPSVATQKFWTHCYRKVAQDPNDLNSRIMFLYTQQETAFLGFLRNAKEEQNSTYNERPTANKTADSVIQYEKFEYLDIQIDSFEQYYTYAHSKYCTSTLD